MEKHRSTIFILFLSASVIIIGGLVMLSPKKAVAPTTTGSRFSVKPTPTVFEQKESTFDYPSPDGKFTLLMKNVKEEDGTVTQTFTISGEDDTVPVEVYSKNSSTENLITVPDNTFSPNNKYVLLQYNDSGKTRYIVLRTDGKDIKKDEKTVEIVKLFEAEYPDFVITDVTGWGGYSLIVVNTDTKEGKTGPSWWFDAASFSFIRLSTRFN